MAELRQYLPSDRAEMYTEGAKAVVGTRLACWHKSGQRHQAAL